ncbi:GHKL domain-containing protein [Butyrivibrio hungatei DSM 14810]|uniref:Two component system histidine kinase n=2 Tax=Butyrivibrio hungatei TaxID=185008 RepID=A0A1D9P0L0_9FIRM|nr:ATP-binding protein [Butyrivibrio hungatei]AOZ95735.1 two component system histidine kinase [Butyrivibrio hungatei]SHN58370.1 GHKL domain-containing protein [Butyrivibrio hungatei DSM 14810]
MENIYQDIPRLYTALAEWLACMIYCLVLKRKIGNKTFIIFSVLALIVQSVFLVFTKNLPVIFWIPCMLIAVGFMYLFLYLTCDTSRNVVGYYCARAFLLAELAASLEWQLACFFLTKNDSYAIQILILVSVYVLVFTWAHYMEVSITRGIFQLEINYHELWAAIAIAAAIFAFSNLSFIVQNTPFSAGVTADVFYIRTLVDIAGIMILYVYQSRICELLAEKELRNIHSMLKAQYDKYRGYQTTFDMINMKYHDLKHQIAGLRSEMSDEERKKWIDTLEQELESYSPELQTGNSVLDTLIAGKMMNCRANNIKITCVADGNILDFMHVADICTVFGNALDNAIESVSLIEDPEKRLIHMAISPKKNFVLIQINNYCENHITMKNGYPVTTKADKGNHGFGLKSIRYTLEKYHGTVNFDIKDNWFELKMLIPKGGVS